MMAIPGGSRFSGLASRESLPHDGQAMRSYPLPSMRARSVFFPYKSRFAAKSIFKVLVLLASPTGFEPVLPP